MNKAICVLFVVFLAGCAVQPPQSSVQPPPETVRYVQVRVPSAVDKALLYVDKVRGWDEEARREERERLAQALLSGGDDKVRLRYALLLIWAWPEGGLKAQRAALEAIRPESFEEDAPLVAALVETLSRSLEEGPRRLERRWRHQLRVRERRIQTLQAENRRLQSQIDALKAIERSIQQRMSP